MSAKKWRYIHKYVEYILIGGAVSAPCTRSYVDKVEMYDEAIGTHWDPFLV